VWSYITLKGLLKSFEARVEEKKNDWIEWTLWGLEIVKEGDEWRDKEGHPGFRPQRFQAFIKNWSEEKGVRGSRHEKSIEARLECGWGKK